MSPSFLVHKDGDTVELFCDATATPEPRVTWRKDDQEMTSSERVRVTPTRVKIRDADRKDGGAYTCTFRNAVGHVSHTIKLVIEGQSRDRKRSTAYLLTVLTTTLRDSLSVVNIRH